MLLSGIERSCSFGRNPPMNPSDFVKRLPLPAHPSQLPRADMAARHRKLENSGHETTKNLLTLSAVAPAIGQPTRS
jgi:hypothetical protein